LYAILLRPDHGPSRGLSYETQPSAKAHKELAIKFDPSGVTDGRKRKIL
jgi:hypothetical protein